jgi:hypothetical protein
MSGAMVADWVQFTPGAPGSSCQPVPTAFSVTDPPLKGSSVRFVLRSPFRTSPFGPMEPLEVTMGSTALATYHFLYEVQR